MFVNARFAESVKMSEDRRVNRSSLAFAALVAASTVAISADAALTRTGTPQVAFHASGPAGMRIDGTTHDLNLSESGSNIVMAVPLANLTTGISLRDHHMRDKYLQIGSYPNAVLTVDRGALHLPAGDGSASGTAQGTMTIHGRTKNVSVRYAVIRGGGALRVSGSTNLDIRDFGIDVPTYLGITVKPDITVEAQFTATE